MKLICQADVNSRLLPAAGLKKTNKAARCILSLGRKPASIDKAIYLMITNNQSPSGVFYKVWLHIDLLKTIKSFDQTLNISYRFSVILRLCFANSWIKVKQLFV